MPREKSSRHRPIERPSNAPRLTGLAWLDNRRTASLFCAAVLVVYTFLTRYGSLGVVSFNPDENQYEAQASFLIESGWTTFSVPFGPTYMIGVYEILGTIFGPYCMYQVRILVCLIVLAMAGLIFRMVEAHANRGWALLAALIFVYLNPHFDGLSANREWFAGLPILVSGYLFWKSRDRARRRAYWLLFSAGVFGALGIWMKDQAIIMVFAIPAVLVYEALANRRLKEPLLEALCYAAGGAAGVVLGLLPFAIAGTLDDLIMFVSGVAQPYAYAAVKPPAGGDRVSLYFQAFYVLVPFRRLFLIVYGLAAITIAGALWRMLRGPKQAPQLSDDRLIALFVSLLIFGMLAIQTGWKFFSHYYLFIMPSVAVLSAFGLRMIMRMPRDRPTSWGVWLALLAAALSDWLLLPARSINYSLGLHLWEPHVAIPTVIGVGMLALAGMYWWRKQEPITNASAKPAHTGDRWFMKFPLALLLMLGVLGIELAWFFLHTTWVLRPAEMRMVQHWPLPLLTRYLQNHSGPEDSLFVWGWRPEIYSNTRLPAATRIGTSSYIFIDANSAQTGDPIVIEPTATLLMEDLANNRPKWIVDASGISESMSSTKIYRLENFPPLVELLKREYTLAARRNDCDVYVRNDSASPPGSTSIRPDG